MYIGGENIKSKPEQRYTNLFRRFKRIDHDITTSVGTKLNGFGFNESIVGTFNDFKTTTALHQYLRI